jgi:hypothetical protein
VKAESVQFGLFEEVDSGMLDGLIVEQQDRTHGCERVLSIFRVGQHECIGVLFDQNIVVEKEHGLVLNLPKEIVVAPRELIFEMTKDAGTLRWAVQTPQGPRVRRSGVPDEELDVESFSLERGDDLLDASPQ